MRVVIILALLCAGLGACRKHPRPLPIIIVSPDEETETPRVAPSHGPRKGYA
jgi:hypothetical protein